MIIATSIDHSWCEKRWDLDDNVHLGGLSRCWNSYWTIRCCRILSCLHWRQTENHQRVPAGWSTDALVSCSSEPYVRVISYWSDFCNTVLEWFLIFRLIEATGNITIIVHLCRLSVSSQHRRCLALRQRFTSLALRLDTLPCQYHLER